MSAEQEVKDWCTAYYSQKYTDGKSAAQNWDKNYADEKVWSRARAPRRFGPAKR